MATQDGAFAPQNPFSPASIPYAKYGINFGGKHMEYARRGGVLTSVTAPNNLASGPPTPMRGVSTFFRTSGKNGESALVPIQQATRLITSYYQVLEKFAMPKGTFPYHRPLQCNTAKSDPEEVALHVVIGHASQGQETLPSF